MMDSNQDAALFLLKLDTILLNGRDWKINMSESSIFSIDLSHPVLGNYKFDSLYDATMFVNQIKADLLEKGITI